MVYLLQITIGQYLLIFINKNGRPSIQFPEFLIQCLIRHIISTDVTINSVISAGGIVLRFYLYVQVVCYCDLKFNFLVQLNVLTVAILFRNNVCNSKTIKEVNFTLSMSVIVLNMLGEYEK